jgi:DNA repair protein SbcD/Mre11
MKFAHMADVHIGSWRDPKLKELSTEAFLKAVNICIDHKVDFILISGDLFNTALPGLDSLKSVVRALRALRIAKVHIYVIPGSHDFSPSGKTMIDVLEEAGLVKNVMKNATVHNGKLHLAFTIDEHTGAKITGMLGRRGALEKNYYENLELSHLEKEDGFKIFMFHSAIKELMPSQFALMDTMELSYLPKGFDYYAGGHVHIVKEHSEKHHKNVVYPGPLFPASFTELEDIGSGGFYIYDNGKIIREDIHLKNTFVIEANADHKSPEEVETQIMDKIAHKELINTIVLLRISGTLKSGKISDIRFREIFDNIYFRGAFYVAKNVSKLGSEEFEEIHIDKSAFEDVEDALIREHLQQVKVSGMPQDREYDITKSLIKILSSEKHEGEKTYEYEDRIRKETDKILEL